LDQPKKFKARDITGVGIGSFRVNTVNMIGSDSKIPNLQTTQ